MAVGEKHAITVALSSHAASIPTLNEWSLMLLAAMVAASGLLSLRKNG